MSPGIASRIPATPRISIDPSPTTSPPSSAASSANVRVIMRAASLARGADGGLAVELLDHVGRQVERLVGIDDESRCRVEHQIETLLRGDLLHRRPDHLHDHAGGALVLLGGAPLRAPHVLDEPLVLADRPLQPLLLLLALERREDRTLVAQLGAQLVDRLFLLGRLVPPALDP